jgi:hypothetical protein
MDVEVLMPSGPYYTAAEKAEIWERRRRGESVSVIARGMGRHRNAVREYLKLTGGVRPRPRRRSPRELGLGRH